jgi:glutathione S-transferase
MRLYISHGACSLSPHIICKELGLDVELRRVDLRTGKSASGGDFCEINANGYVPALVLDSGEVLTEGAAIAQYLADLRPETALVPAAGSFARYRTQELLSFIGTELHKSYSVLFHTAVGEYRKQVEDRLQVRLAYVAQLLAGQDYLSGDSFSIADAYLYTVLRWSRFVRLDLAVWPALVAYVERVAARPAVSAALEAEGLTSHALR